jgi:hypothetical protein
MEKKVGELPAVIPQETEALPSADKVSIPTRPYRQCPTVIRSKLTDALGNPAI